MQIDQTQVSSGILIKPKVSTKTKMTLPSVLRSIGAFVLMASAVTFLLQSWNLLGHIERYFAFLGFSVLLAGLGFFCGLHLKEDKGARTFLGLATAITPAHFAALGGLIFSVFHGPAAHIPTLVRWAAPDALTVAFVSVIGISVLFVISYLGFASLARKQAKTLTTLFMLLNGVLLLPFRNSAVIGAMALAAFCIGIYCELKWFSRPIELKTYEGRLSRLFLFLPVLLLISRTMLFYSTSDVFLSALFGMVVVFLFVFIPQYYDKDSTRENLQALSVIPLMLAWGFLIKAVMQTYAIDAFYGILLVGLPFAGLLIGMSFFAHSGGAGFRKAAAVVAIGSVGLQLFCHAGLFSAFSALVIGIAVSAYGFTLQEKGVFFSGLLGVTLGLLYHVRYAVELYRFNGWMSLALTGIVTILAASYIEKNHMLIRQRYTRFRKELKSWN